MVEKRTCPMLCGRELPKDSRFRTCGDPDCKRDYKTDASRRRKENQREREKSERNYRPIAVLPPISQMSMHDWPFSLTGRFSNEIKDQYMSANCLNRQGRYEEEDNIAAFWVKEMAAITLPPDSPNVQTLLHLWNKADAFMLYARIFEAQHGIEVAKSYILPGTEGQDAQPEEEEEPAEVPRVRWDCEAELWRCNARNCRGWDRDHAPLELHTDYHTEQDFAVLQVFDQNRGVTLYERYHEMTSLREKVLRESSRLPHAHKMYFRCRVRQAMIVWEHNYDRAMDYPTADVTELKNAQKEGKDVLPGR